MFGLDEAGDEFGIGGVAFVAAEFLHSEGFDAIRIDLVDAGGLCVIERLGDGIAVVAGLFETRGKWA